MGKFSRNREYTFKDFEDAVSNMLEEFDDGSDVTIVLPWEETAKYMSRLMSTNKFKPYLIDYGIPDMDGYNREYEIVICHLIDDDALFVEPIYDMEKDKYFTFCDDPNGVFFVSENVSTSCYDCMVEEGCNTVLFELEINGYF